MSLDVIALRESFQLVVKRSPHVTRRFYEILLERQPQLRPLFGQSMERHEQNLTRALIAVLARLEDGVWLTDTLRKLGARHVGYGVTDEMYAWVGDALLATFEERAGDAWSPRYENAWRDAIATIAAVMIDGGRRHQHELAGEAPLSSSPAA